MPTVYIAGPVFRPHSGIENQVERLTIYRQIQRKLTGAGFQVIVPLFDELAERAEPRAFFQMMKERIASADFVITIFPDRNRSVPVESAIASFMNKRQFVIAHDVESLPRILKGLPGVDLVARAENLDAVLTELQRRFMAETRTDSWGSGGDEGGGGENTSGGPPLTA